jgi:hypothetical protein
MSLGIVAITILGMTAIVLGISFAKGNGGFWSRGNKEKGAGFIGETVGGALKGAFSSLGELKNLAPRRMELSVEKYAYDSFRVKTLGGDVTVCGHDLPGAKAELEILEKEEGDTEAFFEDGEIKLRTKSGKRSLIGDAKIWLPGRLASLIVESVNGDIAISDFVTDSATTFKGVNGDISVSGLKNTGEVSVKTVSGDVSIKESQFKALTAQSISGDLRVSGSAADSAVLKTVSGDIDYADSDIKNPTVKTVSGRVNK